MDEDGQPAESAGPPPPPPPPPRFAPILAYVLGFMAALALLALAAGWVLKRL